MWCSEEQRKHAPLARQQEELRGAGVCWGGQSQSFYISVFGESFCLRVVVFYGFETWLFLCFLKFLVF